MKRQLDVNLWIRAFGSITVKMKILLPCFSLCHYLHHQWQQHLRLLTNTKLPGKEYCGLSGLGYHIGPDWQCVNRLLTQLGPSARMCGVLVGLFTYSLCHII